MQLSELIITLFFAVCTESKAADKKKGKKRKQKKNERMDRPINVKFIFVRFVRVVELYDVNWSIRSSRYLATTENQAITSLERSIILKVLIKKFDKIIGPKQGRETWSLSPKQEGVLGTVAKKQKRSSTTVKQKQEGALRIPEKGEESTAGLSEQKPETATEFQPRNRNIQK